MFSLTEPGIDRNRVLSEPEPEPELKSTGTETRFKISAIVRSFTRKILNFLQIFKFLSLEKSMHVFKCHDMGQNTENLKYLKIFGLKIA